MTTPPFQSFFGELHAVTRKGDTRDKSFYPVTEE